MALVCGMTGRQYTYEMAQQMSQKFGSSLRRCGAQKGDVVALISKDFRADRSYATLVDSAFRSFTCGTYHSFPLQIFDAVFGRKTH